MSKGKRIYLSVITLILSVELNPAMATPEEYAFRGIFHSVYLAASKGTYKVFSEQKSQLVTKLHFL